MARRHAIGMSMRKAREMTFMTPEKGRKPCASPSSSFIGNMLMKATVPLAIQTAENSAPSPPMERYRLLVVGDNSCGKTCLLNSLVKTDFEVDESVCGIFDESVVQVRVGAKTIEFMLWDLSGHENYDGLRVELYQDVDVFLVCFDVGNPGSLESAEDMWIPEIKDVAPETPFILVGCKNDLRTDSNLDYFLTVPGDHNNNEPLDSVGKNKAERVAAETGAKDYIECCAKTKFNISEVFKLAGHAVFCKNDPSYTLQAKPNFGFLSRYAKRRSTEVGEKLQTKKGNKQLQLFPPEKHGRRGSLF